MKALNLAIDGKVTENVVPSFKNIDSFLKEWNLGLLDERNLFLAIANVLRENKRYDFLGFFSLFAFLSHVYKL